MYAATGLVELSHVADFTNKPQKPNLPVTRFYHSSQGQRHVDIRKQEAQLMLTNPRDAFRGQSRSPKMVPFDMLGMVSY